MNGSRVASTNKSQKNGSKKSALKRQTYRQIIKIKGHLQESPIANERAKLVERSKKNCHRCRWIHCKSTEKLLHAINVAEGTAGPLRSLIAECYSLLYGAGRTRTMFDTLSRWVDILNDKQPVMYVARYYVALKLFKAQGRTYLHIFRVLTALGKQINFQYTSKAGYGGIFEVINCYAGKHSHAAALEFLSTAAKDKSSETEPLWVHGLGDINGDQYF